MRLAPASLLLLALAPCLALRGAGPQAGNHARRPSSRRPIGEAHTLRTIPEACARIEGMFTGQAAEPYKFARRCAPAPTASRARASSMREGEAVEKDGWKFNDLIRVPSAACPSQQAVVRVWRKPADAAPPELDAQGRSRIYLKDATEAAKAQGADGADVRRRDGGRREGCGQCLLPPLRMQGGPEGCVGSLRYASVVRLVVRHARELVRGRTQQLRGATLLADDLHVVRAARHPGPSRTDRYRRSRTHACPAWRWTRSTCPGRGRSATTPPAASRTPTGSPGELEERKNTTCDFPAGALPMAFSMAATVRLVRGHVDRGLALVFDLAPSARTRAAPRPANTGTAMHFTRRWDMGDSLLNAGKWRA